MFFKIFPIILLCKLLPDNILANTILIGQGQKIVYREESWSRYSSMKLNAEFVEEHSLFSKKEIILKCGELKLVIEHEPIVFAEFVVNYGFSGKPIKIYINFNKNEVIVKFKRDQRRYPYTAENIAIMESYIRSIERSIEFKVVKIYIHKIHHKTPLDNDSIYDETIKKKLSTLEKSSWWDCIKLEPVDLGTEYYETLADLINNSTTYKKSIAFAVEQIKKIMVDRAYKYALLSTVYAYEAARIVYKIDFDWSKFENTFEKLSDVPIKFKDDKTILDYRYKFYNGRDIDRTLQDFHDVIKDILEHIVKIDELNKYKMDSKLNVTRHPKSTYSNTHILPQKLLEKFFRGFAKPLTGDLPYNFHVIPSAHVDIKAHLNSIFKLVEVEFENIPEIK